MIVEAFGFKKDLVTLAVAELDDLVLDRRAVTRADAFDRTGIHGRAPEIGADDLMRGERRAGNAAVDLRIDDAVGKQRERLRILVGRLLVQRSPVDRTPVEAGRRPRLQPAELEARVAHRRRQPHAGLLVHAARDNLLFADVDKAAQEGAGGQNDRAAAEPPAIREHDSNDLAIPDLEIMGLALDHIKAVLVPNRCLHRLAIELPVRLGTRAAHGRALAAVEQAELDTG